MPQSVFQTELSPRNGLWVPSAILGIDDSVKVAALQKLKYDSAGEEEEDEFAA